jgi:protein-tyrosine phosphatase
MMTSDASKSILSTPSNINIRPAVVDYNISQITPYVFVTAEDTARQFPKIFSNGIHCVINVADELPQILFPPQSGIESLKYPVRDNPAFPASHYFDTVADRIAANAVSNRRTLIYCHHGRSRSVTFILAYLIKYHHLPLQTAFALVKEKRQLALPNSGFWSQLKSYELYQQHQKQQQHAASILRNLQNTMTHTQQILHKLSHGFEHLLSQDRIVNAFINTTHSNRPRPISYHRIVRRRIPVYPHLYHVQSPFILS